jgi:hypothetical protein
MVAILVGIWNFVRLKERRVRTIRLTTAGHDLGHLSLPIIVQQLIGFVNDGVTDTSERQDVGLGHEVKQATRGGDKDVTALGKLSLLLANRTAAVSDARTQHRAIAETTRLIKNLAAELTGGSNDEDEWFRTDSVTLRIETVGEVGARSSKLLGLAHKLGETRDHVSSSLTGTW